MVLRPRELPALPGVSCQPSQGSSPKQGPGTQDVLTFLMPFNQLKAERKIRVKRVFHEPDLSQGPVVWLRSEKNLVKVLS